MVKTILIKLSGESLAGNKKYGLDFDYIKEICLRIKNIHDMGVRVAIVCGGGNFLRGRDAKAMDRERADYVGMLATVMNSLVLRDMFIQIGCEVYNQSGLEISIIDNIDKKLSLKALDENKIVIFGGGTGKPFFSTDTGASLRAVDIGADIIVKLTNVDGVYDKDPNKYSDAVMYDEITFDDVLKNKLGIMDMEAIEMCRDNNIEIAVININISDGLNYIVENKKIGTRVVCKLIAFYKYFSFL